MDDRPRLHGRDRIRLTDRLVLPHTKRPPHRGGEGVRRTNGLGYFEALAARRLLKMSKATASSRTKPLMKDCTSLPRPSSDMPLFSTPMIRPPIMAPVTVPMPPVTAAPPMNTA